MTDNNEEVMKTDIDVNAENPAEPTMEIQPIEEGFKSPILTALETAESIDDVIPVIHGNYGDLTDLVNEINTDDSDKALFKEMIRRDGPEKATLWIQHVINSINHLSRYSVLDRSINTPGAKWLQGVFRNNKLVNIGRPDVKVTDSDNGILTGMQAIMKVRQVMERGDFTTVHLPHSGFWASLQIDGDDLWLDMQSAIHQEKSDLGRSTLGMVFGNLDVIIFKHMSRFLINRIYKTSVGITDPGKLQDLIKAPDIYVLAHAYLAGRFKSGYTLNTSCVARAEAGGLCGHTVSERVNLARMLIVDHSRITETQAAHMSTDTGHTVTTVSAYQEAFDLKKAFEIMPSVFLNMRVPTVADKINEGIAWLEALEASVTDAFKEGSTREERETMIKRKAALSSNRSMAHWIASIEIGGQVISDRKDIGDALAEFTTDDKITKAISNAVIEFGAQATVALMAIPRWTCPSCGNIQPVRDRYMQAFTPLNVEKVFFTVMTSTLARIYEREEV